MTFSMQITECHKLVKVCLFDSQAKNPVSKNTQTHTYIHTDTKQQRDDKAGTDEMCVMPNCDKTRDDDDDDDNNDYLNEYALSFSFHS